MKRSTILLLVAVMAISFGACKKKGDKKADGDKGGMAPVADMQPADMKPADMKPADMKPAGPDAFAHMEKVLAAQKEYIKLLEGIKTLDDVKKNKAAYIAAGVKNMKLQVEAMKMALAMDDATFKTYIAKADKMQKENAPLAKKVMKLMAAIGKIKGVKKLSAELQKEVAAKQKPLLTEMGALVKKFMARKAKLAGDMKAADMKPADMKAAKKGKK